MLTICGCSNTQQLAAPTQPCSEAWFQDIDARVGASDGQGHGPDIGSLEWRSVIEFRLSSRGSWKFPTDLQLWCGYVDKIINAPDKWDCSCGSRVKLYQRQLLARFIADDTSTNIKEGDVPVSGLIVYDD